jgi:uncharacterized membrane-anchored protein
MQPNSQPPSTTPVVLEQLSEEPQRPPYWRFAVASLVQAGIIIAAPAQPFYIQLTGKTAILQTAPVDPYNFLQGYSQTLSYSISRQEDLQRLPGWQQLIAQQQAREKSLNLPTSASASNYLHPGKKIYVILEKSSSSESNPPDVWKPLGVTDKLPASLPANQIALKGKVNDRAQPIEYGLETYYMPESQREQINQDINQARWSRKPQPVVVEVKIDSQGNAVPISFWVGDRNYRF